MKTLKKISVILFLFSLFNSHLFSQNIAITDDNGYTANSSAMLDVKSTTKGMLVPRLTTLQRTNVNSPATGLLVFDTSFQCFFYFNGTTWVNLLSTSDYAGGPDVSLFAIVNEAGDTVFAVYPGGVRINVADSVAKASGSKRGFAVGGFSSGKGFTHEFLRVTPDSVRIYIDTSSAKASGSKRGFAVGGFSSGKTLGQEYLRVCDDSVRIYVNDGDGKASGSKRGFAVGGFNSSKANTGNYLHVTPENTFLGYEAGINTTPDNPSAGDGKYNSFMGYRAGFNNTSGQHNICLGHQAGYNISSGDYNTFIGTGSGFNYTSIGYNTCVGINSGHYTLTGQGNTFLGCNSGWIFENGGGNTLIGTDCGRGGNDGTYNPIAEASTNNSMLGYKAGYYIEGGDNNSFVGAYSGFNNITGSGNVFLGSYAGYSETASNKLYIDNSSTTSPLIYGDFNTNILRFNANVGINIAPDESYSLKVSGNVYVSGNINAGSVTGDLTGNVTGNVNGLTMGKIYRDNSTGSLVSTFGGLFDLWWDSGTKTVIVKNTSSTYCHLWWQGQQQASTVGGSTVLIPNTGTQDIVTFTGNNGWGYEIHFGQENGSAYCSAYIQYSNGKIFGHYIKY